MAAPQRKQPERRKKAVAPPPKPLAVRLGAGLLRGLVWPILVRPKLAAGFGVFLVVYSFVAANALWYQHGSHPSPLLATRTAPTGETLASADHPDAGVTTFRIEREAEAETAKTATRGIEAKPDPLVAEIQKALAARDLYVGPADGLMGPKTAAAIQFFEETEGMNPTGEASTAVLARLKKKPGSAPVVVPTERYGDQTASVTKTPKAAAKVQTEKARETQAGDDPVADLITSGQSPDPVVTGGDPMVLKIQKGLMRYYPGIQPDGIAGQRTREAIRSFQKHYNLPVDGEPSPAVLKKLQSIGAA